MRRFDKTPAAAKSLASELAASTRANKGKKKK
jgi:hypothetical protein